MPRTAINYNNTTIYKLCCNDLTIKDIYVGHTTNFIKRKANHKKSTNTPTDPLYDTYKYQFIRNNGGFDNWAMIEIIKISCADFNDACRVERQYMEQLNATLNKNKPIITPNEKEIYYKEYFEQHKERLIEYQKEYAEQHKDHIRNYQKEYQKEYAKQHKDQIKEYQKEYRKKHKNYISTDSTDGETSE